MTKSNQYVIGAAILGVVALFFLGAFGGSVYALFETKRAVFGAMSMLFGVAGFAALCGSLCGFQQALS
jgi:hypothetical protein